MKENVDPKLFLEEKYNEAEKCISVSSDIDMYTSKYSFLKDIIDYSERSKGVYTVFLTSVVYKCLYPDQDIRMHQVGIEGGYSGRSFDTRYITPFLKEKSFPAMAESGWLTRSLEQKVPYDKHYTGAIRPKSLKDSFLEGMEYIEASTDSEVQALLVNLLAALIAQRMGKVITLAKPTKMSINQMVDLLRKHFTADYHVQGAARLPVLAIYAVYQLMTEQMKRFEGKELLPLERHTSADKQSGRVGDIDVIDKATGKAFEGVEIKLDIPITYDLLVTSRDKIITQTLDRYYILSTSTVFDEAEMKRIYDKIEEIKNLNGCQVIVNGIYDSLKYYLRMIDKPERFMENYVVLLEEDKDIKFDHREMWNNLVNEQMK